VKKYTEGGNSPWMKLKMAEAEDAEYEVNAFTKEAKEHREIADKYYSGNKFSGSAETAEGLADYHRRRKKDLENEMLRGEKK